ncbi:hypothetical protein NRIC_05670 [Enterococcus florum]|uniref:ASCH domain-containing protein n=1 Tax=Enterococcus florum TaxID=2480627 RepID=A0A4P5P5G5_9ENTE|nr:hypothetical protein [Enterococcus florum]GCF92676.1 hypothetical protein NRIC_05670 [Enterococcus florum]
MDEPRIQPLSLRGDFLLAILAGKKKTEYRTRKWNLSGDLLLAATRNTKEIPQGQEILPGYAMAVVSVVGRHQETNGEWAYELSNIRAITPFPIRGYAGIYYTALERVDYRPELEGLTTEAYVEKMKREGFRFVKSPKI